MDLHINLNLKPIYNAKTSPRSSVFWAWIFGFSLILSGLFLFSSSSQPVLAASSPNPCVTNSNCDVTVQLGTNDPEGDALSVIFSSSPSATIIWCNIAVTSPASMIGTSAPNAATCTTPDTGTYVGPFTAKASYRFSLSGTYTVQYNICDNAGHCTLGSETVDVTKDTAPPSQPGVPYITGASNPNNNGNYFMSWTAATDTGGSGFASYEVYENKNSAGFAYIGSTASATYPGPGYRGITPVAGSYVYQVRGKDNALNLGPFSGSSLLIVVDVISPTPTVTTFPNVNNSNKSAVTLSGACESGVSVVLSVDDSINNPITSPVSGGTACNSGYWSLALNLSGLNDGGLTATVTQTDAAGNIGTSQKTSGKDVVAPTCVISQNVATLSAVCADGGSGCTGNPANQTITAAGAYTFNVTDNVGNTGSCSITEYAHYTYTWNACGSFGAWDQATHVRTGSQSGTVAATTYNTTSPSDSATPTRSCTETDTDNPTLDSFSVTPQVTSGLATFSFAGSDIIGTIRSGVNHYEIWRGIYNSSTCATGTEGSACSWAQEGANVASSPVTNSLLSGVYWYGMHVVDNSGRFGTESTPLKVTVDKVNPTCVASLGGAGGSVASAICSDIGGSNCTGNPANQSVTSDGTYTFNVSDNAGNTGLCSVTAYVHYTYSAWGTCGSFGAWNTTNHTRSGTQSRSLTSTYYDTTSPSDTPQALSQSCTETDTIAPTPRPDLTLTGSPTNTSFTLSWVAATSTDLNHYELWRAPDSSGSPGIWAVVTGKDNIAKTTITTTDIPPSDGTYWYGVHAVDNAGNYATETTFRSGIKDIVAPADPTVTGTTLTNDTTPTWSWNTPTSTTAFKYKMGSGGTLSAETTATEYTPASGLVDSTYTLYVQGRDAAGNWSGFGTLAVVVDTGAPTDPTVSGTTPTIDTTPTWTWNTPTSTTAFKYKMGSGGTLSAETTATEYTPASGLVDSTYTLYVQGRDAAGNWSGFGTKAIVVDTAAPTPRPDLTLTGSPTNTSFTLSWVAATSTDLNHYELWRAPDSSGSPGIWAVVTGKDNIAKTTITTTDIPPSDGTYWYGVHAVDNVGNYSTETIFRSGIKDTTAPTGQPTCTPATSYFNSSLAVSCTVGTGGTVIRYTTDNTAPTASSSVWSNTSFSVTTILKLISCDAAGNCLLTSPTNYTYSKDATAPTCGTWTPASSAWHYSGGTTFTLASSTDTGGSGIKTAGGNCTTGVNNNNTCSVTIDDNAGNTTSCTSPVNRVDNIAPVVTTFSVTPALANSAFSITRTATDTGGSGLAGYEIYRAPDNAGAPGTWTSLGNVTSNTPATSGTWWYGVHATDNAGNCITEDTNNADGKKGHCGGVAADGLDTRADAGPISVVFDNLAPTAPAVSAATPTSDQTPTWTWVGGGGGNGTYRYRLDNADLTTGATTTTTASYTPATNLTAGVHTLYVQERDVVGNWSSSGSRAVTIDLTNPTAGACSFSPAGWTYGDVTASVTFTDSSGVVAPTTKTCLISAVGGNCSVTAQDNVGNSTTATCTATNMDRTAPQIVSWGLNGSISNALISKDYPVFTWQVSDAGSGVRTADGIELWRAPYVAGSCDGTAMNGCSWGSAAKKKFSAASTGGTDNTLGTTGGKYVYGLHVVDGTVAPNPPGNCIAESKAHCGGVATDSLDASRTAAGPFVMNYDIAPPPPPTVDPTTPAVNTTVPANKPRFTLTATDSDGIATITVTLRCTGNPAAGVLQPWCNLSGADDPDPIVKNCAGATSCDFSQEFTRKVAGVNRPLSNGVYTVVLGVIDLAGNSWTDSWPFTVSNVKPQPPILR